MCPFSTTRSLAPVGDSGRDPDTNRFTSHATALAVADRATLAGLAALATARRTRLGKHHVAARPPNVPSPATLPALRFGNGNLATTGARPAGHLTCHQHLPLDAVDRIGKRHRHRRVQVGPDFRPRSTVAWQRMQHVGKQLRKRRRLRAALRGGEIELREHERGRVRPCAARTTGGVVLPPPPRIDECLVGLDDPLKHLLGAAVTRVDTGMVAASQPAIGPLDVGGRRRLRNAEDDVKIHGSESVAQGSGLRALGQRPRGS